ncbi:MAG TPA: zinc ribbon domain-containing protein [Xanthobacteraceae bacterium]|nr:zinc ribbon domain-containing protein [Xanthobacteraceae bacterium]
MPVYDYDCRRCGPFTTMRPMAESDRPAECPHCGRDAARAFFTAPYFAAMPAERRSAHAANERSAHAPLRLANLGGRHGSGCDCCRQRSTRSATDRKNGAKSFPGRRPWMLSH